MRKNASQSSYFSYGFISLYIFTILIFINLISEDWLIGEIKEEENAGDNLHPIPQNHRRFSVDSGDPLEPEIQLESPEIMEGLEAVLDLSDEAAELRTEGLAQDPGVNLDARGTGKEDPLEPEIQLNSPEIMEGLEDILDLGDEAGELRTEELEQDRGVNLDARETGKEGNSYIIFNHLSGGSYHLPCPLT